MNTPENEPDERDALEPDQTELDDAAEAVEPGDDDAVREDEVDDEVDDAGQSIEAVVKAMDAETRRHARAWAKIVEVDEEELHACPTCDGIGFTSTPVEAEPELVQDPFLERCARCNGIGEVKTGAALSGLWKVPCSGCGGAGYVTLAEQPAIGAEGPNGAPAPVGVPPVPVVSPADPATVAELRARGYMVVEPIVVPAGEGG